MSSRSHFFLSCYLAIFFFMMTPCLAIVPLKHVKEIHILIKTDILVVGKEGTDKISELSADIPAGKKGFMIKALSLKGEGQEEEVVIELDLRADARNEDTIVLDIDSRVKQLGSSSETEFTRNDKLEIIEGSSSLFEIYTSQKTGKKIVLNLSGTMEEIETFQPSYPSTTKVLFQLNIYRISNGKDILLEQNSLSTVIGQSASYYLHLYAGEQEKKKKGKPDEDELDIRMTPLSIADEVAEVEISIAGRILKSSGKDMPVDLRETEKIANTSSHAVIVAIEEKEGVAQEGYKFEIIPSF